jgi:hypothetical protein
VDEVFLRDKDDCQEYLRDLRWPDEVTCPHCDEQQRPLDVHHIPVKGVVGLGRIRWSIRIDAELVTHRRYKTHPINEFSLIVTLCFPNTVRNDVDLVGRPDSGGLARSVP